MKPKVTIIITRSEIGGAQNYVLSLISALEKEFHFILLVGSDCYLSKALREIGVEVYLIPELDSSNIFKAVFRVRKLLIELNSDLINTHSAFASAYGRLAALGLKTPTVYSVHGWFFANDASPIRKHIGPIIERLLSKATDFWIVETKFDENLGLNKNIIPHPDKSLVVANGTPPPVQRNRLALDPDFIQLVFVGRISYQKNPSLAINIIALLPENYVLTLYCDNANDEDLVALIYCLGLNARVTLIDSESDTASIIHSFDLMLVTSRYEGMPLAIIDAMRAGLPIICPRVCGLDELVEQEGNGYLIDQPIPSDYSIKIIEIFENKALAMQMQQRSVDLYLQNHTIEKMSASIARVFNRQIRIARAMK